MSVVFKQKESNDFDSLCEVNSQSKFHSGSKLWNLPWEFTTLSVMSIDLTYFL